MTKSKSTKKKAYWEMGKDELAAATSRFDREQAGTPGHRLTVAQQAQHERARGRGRPKVGQGSERINVTIERGLLGKADALARTEGLSRAEIIAAGLRRLIEINAVSPSTGKDARLKAIDWRAKTKAKAASKGLGGTYRKKGAGAVAGRVSLPRHRKSA